MILPITPYLLYVLPFLAFCWFLGMVGRAYKFGFWGNFLLSLFFTPIIGFIILLAQDRRLGPKK